jgi:hypothetical protein
MFSIFKEMMQRVARASQTAKLVLNHQLCKLEEAQAGETPW